MRHTQSSDDMLSCLTDGAHAEMLRRLCANQGAVAPLRIGYLGMTRPHEPEIKYMTRSRPAGQGLETNRHCGWVVGAS